MTEPRPSLIKRIFAALKPSHRNGPSAAPISDQAPGRPMVHDLNNILGVIIGCFDEQLEQLDKQGDLDRVKIRQLAQDGLAAALRGAALTRKR